MTISPPPKYLAWIDQVKGIAILAIVIFHFLQNYPFRTSWVNILYQLGIKAGFAAVAIFFVIAGFNTSYVLARKLELKQAINWKEWLGKRLLRMYPTYWLAIAVTLILYALFNSSKIISLSELFLIAIGYPNYRLDRLINPGFWFFSVILQFYLIAPLIFKITRYNAQKILWLGMSVAASIKLACLTIIPSNTELFEFLHQLYFVGSYLFDICLGIYWGFIFYKYQAFRSVDIINSVGIFTVGLMLYVGLSLKGIDFSYNLGFDMLFTPLFFLICYWIFSPVARQKFPNIKILPLTILGRYSYQVYLVHQPLLFVLLPMGSSQKLFATPIGLGIFLVAIAIALFVYISGFIQLELGLHYLLWQRNNSRR